jgi:serine phosphatase RsbU (regulator of sigma subunit)
MERLNRMMLRLLPEEIATMCLLSMDPASGRIRLTNAGHPPPLRVRDGRVTQVEGRVALLGVPTPHDEEIELTLAVGETLVLVTDGLIESRGHTFNDGLAALCVAVADVDADLERFCDRLLTDLGAGSRDDDVALLVIRRVDFG